MIQQKRTANRGYFTSNLVTEHCNSVVLKSCSNQDCQNSTYNYRTAKKQKYCNSSAQKSQVLRQEPYQQYWDRSHISKSLWNDLSVGRKYSIIYFLPRIPFKAMEENVSEILAETQERSRVCQQVTSALHGDSAVSALGLQNPLFTADLLPRSTNIRYRDPKTSSCNFPLDSVV